ncbi:MAG TPA: heparan-alpha-glucosaminide N-acetyltransferase domain-containing protein [Vicinamibacterales bacterium]|nr:heparan-alpha-glucosaminide N-acetyltransferase domain-containing protein [Vicinamibacterales bacterium]
MTGHPAPRLGALDHLRGLTIAAMIVVNNPGNWNSVFPQLMHAAWNGVTLADLIFPAFIFIMGVAVPLALARQRTVAGGASVVRRVLVRSAVLVLLGLALNLAAAWPAVAAIRIPGVLQRIGLTYLVTALIVADASDRRVWTLAVTLLLVQWAALMLPVLPMGGVLEPGHNAGVALDRVLFGAHLLTPSGDPEGALGLLGSVATALAGAGIGRWLLHHAAATGGHALAAPRRVFAPLAVGGTAAVLLGLAWSAVLPFNKPLWTGSFALLACGVATLSLVAFLWAEPAGSKRGFAPLLWLGTNPLAIYFLSELLTNVLQRSWLIVNGHRAAPKDWFYWDVLAPAMGDGGGRWSSLAYAMLYALLWVGVAGVMRRRGVRLTA